MPRSHLFGPEHEEFRGTVRRFIDKEVRPHVDEWEAAGQFPPDLFRRFGALDLLGLKYPEEYGGTHAGVIYEAVLFEELARCGSGGVPIFSTNLHIVRDRPTLPASANS